MAPSAGAERVFVEGALARLDGSELARVRTLDMDRVITGNSPGVISTLGALADPGVPLVIDREGGAPASAGAPAPASNAAEDGVALTRFEVTPAITGDRAVRLDMKIDVSAEGSRHRFTKVELFAGSRLLVWDTDLKTPAGESIVMLVQPAVIESDQDLKAILERRSAPPANR
ncbi:MAG TPA: hypothetical protein VNN80_31750 [Polyangiaceae bacterium]|nr:hypothetical protein [Polyangiaceae bacterium]